MFKASLSSKKKNPKIILLPLLKLKFSGQLLIKQGLSSLYLLSELEPLQDKETKSKLSLPITVITFLKREDPVEISKRMCTMPQPVLPCCKTKNLFIQDK